MKTQKYILLLVVGIILSVNVNAGWVITQQSYDSDEGVETALIETVYLQDGVMKVVQADMITTFDLNKETMTIMSPSKKVFWTGDVAAYKVEIKNAMQSAMDEQLANAADAQKEMIRKMYQGMMESIDDPSKFSGEEPEEYNLQIEKTGDRDRIAGRMATKYKISVNGSLKEEAWLSESDRANAEFDSEKFHLVFGDFISQAGTMAFYQANEKYIEFSKKGFPLKSINYNGGYESISEVTNLEKESIDISEFEVPVEYKKVRLVEMGLGERE
ncbi:MAG: DUF4412 domain-containing protein [Bacteroidales bacterium]|nr:DUF4412 domain-containing protein [Bacteroidales bacterium]